MFWSDYIKYNWILTSVHSHCYQGPEHGVEILQRLLPQVNFSCQSSRPALILCCCVTFDQTSAKKGNHVRKSCKKTCWGASINLRPSAPLLERQCQCVCAWPCTLLILTLTCWLGFKPTSSRDTSVGQPGHDKSFLGTETLCDWAS